MRKKLPRSTEIEQENALDKHMQIIEKEIDISESIISDLLDFTNPLVPHLKDVDLRTLLLETLDRVSLPDTIEVRLDLDEHDPNIQGDPILLGQVFLNIIQNARQAMPAGGKIMVSLTPEDGDLRVKITDTGTGVSVENLKLLFEPFFTTKAKGMGLGLTLSKRIIEAHHGRVEVESVPGEGTTFLVYLPGRTKSIET
jgi:signal transduction histidine kinase